MVPGLTQIPDSIPTRYVSSNVNNFNLGSDMFGPGGDPDPVAVKCYVLPGVTIGSTSLGTVLYPANNGEAALNLNDFAVGSIVILLVASGARIQGCGGNGGLGGTAGGLTFAGGSGGQGSPPGQGSDVGGVTATTEIAGARSVPHAGTALGNPNGPYPNFEDFGSIGGHAVEAVASCEVAVYNEGEIWGGGGGGRGAPYLLPGNEGGAGGAAGEGGESSTSGPFPGPRDPAFAYAIRVENGGPNGSGQAGVVRSNNGTILTTVNWP